MASSASGPRRTTSMVYCDILVALAERARSRTELMKIANLNGRTFDKYVEKFLVAHGYVARKWVNRRIVYLITSKGRFYLGTLVLTPEVSASILYSDRAFASRVAEELRKRGADAKPNASVCIEADLEPTVDMLVEYDGTTAYVLVTTSRPSAYMKLNYAASLARMLGSRVHMLMPKSIGMRPRSKKVVRITYPDGDAAAAAEALLAHLSPAPGEHGRAAAAGRIIRI